jgi:N-acetylglucosaminyl-diphospho-decaprenol L-rhamnosyltransferase
LIDNASPDNSIHELSEAIVKRKWEKWVAFTAASRNGGFAYGNNLGIRKAILRDAGTNYILLLIPILSSILVPSAN